MRFQKILEHVDHCIGQFDFTRFCVGNDVKQGGIILPMFFNIYMDDLSMHLNSSGIGGYLKTAFINLYVIMTICALSVCHLVGCNNYYIFAIRMPGNINCYIMDFSYKRGNEMRFTRFNVVSPLHCLIWINLLFNTI